MTLVIKSVLSDILEERNMTQKELAELAGVTQAAVSRFSRNNRYEITHLFAISRALGVKIEDLFDVKEADE